MSATEISRRERILGGLWGSLVGDALGVPVEFKGRAEVQSNPVTDMREFGTHRQPKGTWSDDGALILCTVDSLCTAEFDTQDMGQRFVCWMNDALWTATGVVFDVGLATTDALMRVGRGVRAETAGGRDEYSNGNGSLMRIIPVALRFANEPTEDFRRHLERASSITHGHLRSRMACAFYGFVVRQLLLGHDGATAVEIARKEFMLQYQHEPELQHFKSILNDDVCSLADEDILSTGYVLHTLHASLWCLLTTNSYSECALKAVNLGGDTDTTGCVAGGLAGVAYGLNSIPLDWLNQLPRQNDLKQLFNDFTKLWESPNAATPSV